MTAKESFLARLDQEKKASEASGPQQQKEWVSALRSLFTQFREWLTGAEAKGLLRVEEGETQTQTAAVGTALYAPFKVPTLKVLTPGGDAVHIVPKARMVVGAMGRVDFECGGRKTMCVRKEPGHWQFARLAADQGGWQFTDLTEESFFATLQDLLA